MKQDIARRINEANKHALSQAQRYIGAGGGRGEVDQGNRVLGIYGKERMRLEGEQRKRVSGAEFFWLKLFFY